MDITELQTLINEAAHHRQMAAQAPLLLKGILYLPPEIQCMIVDNLEDQRDNVSLLIAF